jgi:SAM-dependent methyltransferase
MPARRTRDATIRAARSRPGAAARFPGASHRVSVVDCQACGASGRFAPWFPQAAIHRCGNCGHMTADIGGVDAASLYGAEYFAGGEYHDYEKDAEEFAANFRRNVRELRALVDGGRLLEIGAAYGYFLKEARAAFADCRGIEISDAAASAARAAGFDVATGDVLAMDAPPGGPFDAVCMWDTIEHIDRAGDVYRRVASWLRPGGVIAVTTGDAGSAVARLRGRRWRQIHPPTHIHYFSRTSLDALARTAGLAPERWSHPGYTRSYSSMAHNVFDRRGRLGRAVASAITLGGVLDFPVYLNLYDICLHVARRPV